MPAHPMLDAYSEPVAAIPECHGHLHVSVASRWGQASTPQKAATHLGYDGTIADGSCLTMCKRFAALTLLVLGSS